MVGTMDCPHIYKLRIRSMFNFAASTTSKDPPITVELELCLFIALALQSIVEFLGLATAKQRWG